MRRGRLGEELQRVDEFPVRENFVVDVRAGRSTRRSQTHAITPSILAQISPSSRSRATGASNENG